MTTERKMSIETLRRLLELQNVANVAVRNAQEENRRRGIPNWYSINGKIVSDQQLSTEEKNK